MNPAYLLPLANHLWQSTLFAGIAGLLTLALRDNHARVRHWVWLTASCKFLLPFSVLLWLGGHVPWRTAPQATQANWSLVISAVGQPFTAPAVSSAPISAAQPAASPVPAVLGALWACGFLGIACAWWVRWRRIRAAVRAGSVLHLAGSIRAISSPTQLEPGVFGVVRPVLMLPEGIADRLTPAQFEAVIAHELCHIRHRDNLVAAAHMFVETVFWFHPLVWWIGKRMVEERERACDEDVLLGTVEPRIYAEGILSICKFYVESPLRCVAGVSGADLKRRIAEIMKHQPSEEMGLVKTALLTAAAVAAIAGPVGLGLLNPSLTRAQTQGSIGSIQTVAKKKFEVATIKPGSPKPGWPDDGWQLGPPAHGSIEITNLELKKIIASSFRIQDMMVFGPKWIDSARFNIVGKGPDPTAPNPDVWEMMRSLLADRFQLRYHIEDRPMPAYVLTVAKDGPKLKAPAGGRCADALRAGKACGDLYFLPFGVGIDNMPIGALIGALGRRLQDRPFQLEQRLPIIDRTGLTGKYDVAVKWMPAGVKTEDLDGVPKDQLPPDLTLSEALERQAGLRLQAQKTPIPVVVVDEIEKPSAN